MTTLTLNLPEDLNMEVHELVMLLAAKLYEEGRLSLGQAADLAGMGKRAFAERLGSCNVSIFGQDAAGLSDDVAHA
ncbi:MAG: UPF0175 family protein [Bacteroidetes bacterium]|nr:UPF0175 family protein [Bacteroidota bacterium]